MIKKTIDLNTKGKIALPSISSLSKSINPSPRFQSNSPIPNNLQVPDKNSSLLLDRKSANLKDPNKTISSSVSPLPLKYDPGIQESKPGIKSEEVIKIDLPVYMQDTFSWNNKRNEFEFRSPQKKKSRFQDQDLISAVHTIREQQRTINSLYTEIASLKEKIGSLENSCVSLTQNWNHSEISSENFQSLLKDSENKVKDLQSSLFVKQNELNETKEILKNCEFRRKDAVEQVTELENRLSFYQKQLSSLTEEGVVSDKQILKLKESVSDKEKIIENLNKKMIESNQVLLSEINTCQVKIEELYKAQDLLLCQLEDSKSKFENASLEKNRLQELVSNLQQDIGKAPLLPNRKVNETNLKYLNDVNREEAERWHNRYFALQEELSSLKEKLELYSRNDEYYRAQIAQKNCFIEKLIKEKENQGSDLSETDTQDNKLHKYE